MWDFRVLPPGVNEGCNKQLAALLNSRDVNFNRPHILITIHLSTKGWRVQHYCYLYPYLLNQPKNLYPYLYLEGAGLKLKVVDLHPEIDRDWSWVALTKKKQMNKKKWKKEKIYILTEKPQYVAE